MLHSNSILRLDRAGVIYVGEVRVPLDDLITAHQKGTSTDAILARFPGLTPADLQTALDYHLEKGEDAPARGSEQRDAQWQKWNVILEDDLGTDTPPNEPIAQPH